MGMSGTSARGGVNSGINVTPMCDVMLVLLIIFMVVTPMLQKGVDVKLPAAAYAIDHPDNEDTVTLAVRIDRTLYLDMLPVPEADLVATLREKFDIRTDKTIFLKADENLPYGFIVNVLAALDRVGVEQVGMVTQPEGQ